MPPLKFLVRNRGVGSTGASRPRARVVDLLDPNVAVFAFLLNFVWESWQVPFYRTLSAAPHWQAVKECSLATAGDVAIALVSFWAVAVVAGSRAWVLKPATWQVFVFAGIGLAITVIAEWAATEQLRLWAYADEMPTLPLLGTGLLPLLQWVTLPPLVVWFVRRQLT